MPIATQIRQIIVLGIYTKRRGSYFIHLSHCQGLRITFSSEQAMRNTHAEYDKIAIPYSIAGAIIPRVAFSYCFH